MPRTLSDLSLGNIIYIKENGNQTPYILVNYDDYGYELLRKEAIESRSKGVSSTSLPVYFNDTMDKWITNTTDGFLSGFSDSIINCLLERSITSSAQNGSSSIVSTTAKRITYLPSYDNLFDSDGNYITALKTAYSTNVENDARKTVNDNGGSCSYWTLTVYNDTTFYRIRSTGEAGTDYTPNHTAARPRPILNFKGSTVVSDAGSSPIYLLPDVDPSDYDIDDTEFEAYCSEILSAVFGEEVRNSIVAALRLCYSDVIATIINKGLKGSPGKSAYDIAVEKGFVGTEKEWIDSLKGQSKSDVIKIVKEYMGGIENGYY